MATTPQGRPMRPQVSTLGRVEWVAEIPVTLVGGVPQNQNLQLPNNVFPNDRFVSGVLLQWQGRITNAGANGPTGTLADAPFSLIDTVTIKGTHRIRSAQEPFVSARGADLRELARNYQSSAPNLQGFPPNLGLLAANDIRFDIPIFFYPMQVSLPERVDHLLDAPNYDALQMFLQVADDNNIFTYAVRGAPTFTAFGSAAGVPLIRVGLWLAQAGRHAFEGFVPARVWRYFNEDASADMAANGANVRLQNMNVPRGNKIRAILFKTGVKGLGVTAGNTSYATLSNVILANLKVFRGINKVTRFYADFFQAQEDSRNSYAIAPSVGYALVDYAMNTTVNESLDLTGAAAGPSGDVDVFTQADVTGVANQALVALWEEIRGIPQYPVR
jgi:hypothetical protein